MHGRTRYLTPWAFAFLLASVSGCADSIAAPACAKTWFEADSAGCIEGRVVWSGDLPAAVPFSYRMPERVDDAVSARYRAHTFAPIVDPQSRGVRDAAVFLRGVDPHKAKPWDHPPVLVEQRDLELHVVQGSQDARVGFVHRGDTIEMVSRDLVFHALRARGSGWFTLAFPDADQPLSRPLEQNGVIELTSGAGYYWMRAYLMVDEHPYYTLTDADGRFTLSQVPPGRYEVVCWLPNWRETGHDRNPDTGRVMRLHFAPPAVIKQTLGLRPRQTRDLRFALSVSDF